MDKVLENFNIKKAAFATYKANELNDINDIAATKSEIKGGYYVNDKEIETKIDRIIYRNGKVLTKVYHNNRLCMITMANA